MSTRDDATGASLAHPDGLIRSMPGPWTVARHSVASE